MTKAPAQEQQQQALSPADGVFQDSNLLHHILSFFNFWRLEHPRDIAQLALICPAAVQFVNTLIETTPLVTDKCNLDEHFDTTPARQAMRAVLAATKRPSESLRGEISGQSLTISKGNQHVIISLYTGRVRLPAGATTKGEALTFVLRVTNTVFFQGYHPTRKTFASLYLVNSTTNAAPATAEELQFTDIFSFQPHTQSLNLPAFLDLRSTLRTVFPPLVSLSDMQLLVLLVYVTLPTYGLHHLDAQTHVIKKVVKGFKDTNKMEGHPDYDKAQEGYRAGQRLYIHNEAHGSHGRFFGEERKVKNAVQGLVPLLEERVDEHVKGYVRKKIALVYEFMCE